MQRRDFLRTLSNSATLGVGCTFASPPGAANSSKPSTYTDVPAVSPGDAEALAAEIRHHVGLRRLDKSISCALSERCGNSAEARDERSGHAPDDRLLHRALLPSA